MNMIGALNVFDDKEKDNRLAELFSEIGDLFDGTFDWGFMAWDENGIPRFILGREPMPGLALRLHAMSYMVVHQHLMKISAAAFGPTENDVTH